MTETPVATSAGLSRRRDAMWGILGGVLGVLVGGGSAAIGIFVEGADPLASTSPYPAFFTKRQLLVYDYFLLFLVVLGGVFAVSAVVFAKRSRFPRTDAFGAALASGVLFLLAGTLLFVRLFAVIRGA